LKGCQVSVSDAENGGALTTSGESYQYSETVTPITRGRGGQDYAVRKGNIAGQSGDGGKTMPASLRGTAEKSANAWRSAEASNT